MQTLNIRIAVKDDGSVVLERASRAVDKFGKEADESAASARRLDDSMRSATATVKALVTAYGTTMLIRGAATLVKMGVDYNAQMQQSELGIASIVAGLGEIRDEHGRVVAEADKFAAAQTIALDMQRQLKIEALKTTANYGDLVRVLQDGLAPALQAGIRDQREIVELTARIAQTGGALGIPGDRLGQEIKALLQGEKGPDNQIANFVFAGIDNAKAKMAELRAEGKVFDFLMEKMASFEKAGNEAGNTYSGALSNLQDAIQQALGEATQGTTDSFTDSIKNLTGVIVQFDDEGNAVFNEHFVAGVRALADGFAFVAEKVVDLTMAIPDMTTEMRVWWEWYSRNIKPGWHEQFGPGIGWKENKHGGWDSTDEIRRELEAQDAAQRAAAAATKRQSNVDLGQTFLGGDVFKIGAFNQNVGDIQAYVGEFVAKYRDNAKVLTTLRDEIRKGADTQAALFAAMEKAKAAARPKFTLGGSGGSGSGGAGNATAKLREQLEDYDRYVEQFRRKAEATGDPMQEALAKIYNDRDTTLDKLGDMQEKLKKALGVTFDEGEAAEDREAIRAHFGSLALAAVEGFDKKKIEEAAASLRDINQQTLADAKARFGMETDFALEEQARQNSERLALIEDAGEREIAARVAAIDEWYEAERAQVLESVATQVERERMLTMLDEERTRRIQFTTDEMRRQQREQLVGTKEWAAKMAESIGTVDQAVTRIFGEARLETAGFFSGILDDFIDNREDFSASFDDWTKGLAKSWSRMLSDMLTKTIVNGDSMITQLKGMWQQLNIAGSQGGAAGALDAGLAGAGMGAMVGSVFGGPNNYGAEGGMAGGAIGAIVGSIIPGVGTALGAVIGSAIGTAIGSVITKGKDQIRVAIQNGVATVTETGISADARHEVQTQIQRRIKEEVKGWQSILDLFPEEVKQRLAQMKGDPSKFNLGGGVENADITDEGALNALGDFLGNELPEAVFDSYRNSINVALQTMGVEQGKISQIFEYWGTLQGKELQEAVRYYVTTLVEATDLRDLMAAPFEDRLAEAQRRSNGTALSRMDDLDAQIATTVASASTLTDIEDIVAAQDRVNQMMRQRYEMEIAYLQRIDAIQKQISDSIAAQREQIEMAGMDDQQKIDHIYGRMGQLRSELEVATDPEEIQRLTQQIQQYVSQALGIAPDNEENRQKLLGILADVDALATGNLNDARAEVEAREQKALDLQESMLEALIGIRQVLEDPGEGDDDEPSNGPGLPPRNGQPPTRTPIGEPVTGHPGHGYDWGGVTGTAMVLTQQHGSVESTLAALTRLAQAAEAETKPADVSRMLETWKTEATKMMGAEAIAAAVAKALEDLQIGVEVTGTDGLINATANATTRRIRQNPDSIVPRNR